jgi:hypothetical protein
MFLVWPHQMEASVSNLAAASTCYLALVTFGAAKGGPALGDDRYQYLLSKRDTAGLSNEEAGELGRFMAQYPSRPDLALPRSEPPRPGKPWERGWAIVGIVFAFPFLLTLPGWIGIDHYRKWQNHERDRPIGFIAWGMIMTVFISVFIIVGLIGSIGGG